MLKDRFLKQTNLIKITIKFMLKQIIINKIKYNSFNFINIKCKLINHKKNIYKNSTIANFRKSNKTISVHKHKYRIRENLSYENIKENKIIITFFNIHFIFL